MAQKFTVQDGVLQFAVLDDTDIERIALTYNDGAGNVDTNFNKVSLLLHFDGVDAATTTTDSSDNAHSPITFAGNAQIDTAQSVFGGSSLLLDGTGDWLTIDDSEDWNFGADDFTIECAVRFSVVATARFASHYEPTGDQRAWAFGFDNTNGLRFVYSADGAATVNVDRAWTPSINTQYRLAVSRVGSNLYLFIDGVLQGAAEVITATLHNSNHVLTIGALGNLVTPQTPLNGHLDEMRITKGVGRYNATYTLATLAFPNVRTIVGAGLGNTGAGTTILGSLLTIETDTTLDASSLTIRDSSLTIRDGSLTMNIGTAIRTDSSDGTNFTTDYTNIGLYNITGSPSIDYTIGTGIVPFRIGGDLGDTTTPYFRLYDTGTNQDRRLAFLSEDGGFAEPTGWFVDLLFGPGAPDNSITIGTTATSDLLQIHGAGWIGSPGGHGLRALDSTNTDYIDIRHDGTSVHIDTVTTDSIIFENTTSDFFTLDFVNDKIINYAPLFIEEQVAAAASVATFGQVWTRNDAPNTLMFTDDAGTDFAIGGALAVGGDVTASGTPLNNEVAVFATGTDINSDSTFTWDGSNLSATNIGGILQANLLDKVAAEAISANWDFTAIMGTTTAAINFKSSTPGFMITETDAAVDNGVWRELASAGSLFFQARNDAGTTGTTWMQVDRTGTTVDVVTIGAPLTATSYDGILAANLLDKTVAATVSAVYTFSDVVITQAADTAAASIRLPHGVAPTSPVNGDMWTTTASAFVRINGATQDLLAGGGGVSVSGTPVNNQLAVWTDASTIEGDAGLTYDGAGVLTMTNTGVFTITRGVTDVTLNNTAAGGDIFYNTVADHVFQIGGTAKFEIDNGAARVLIHDWALWIEERSTAGQDLAAYGQLWVKTASPNIFMFTDDVGLDQQVQTIITATTTELEAIANAINTDDSKVAGFNVFNTTTGSPVWAVGSTDGAVWNDGTGTLAHTPIA